MPQAALLCPLSDLKAENKCHDKKYIWKKHISVFGCVPKLTQHCCHHTFKSHKKKKNNMSRQKWSSQQNKQRKHDDACLNTVIMITYPSKMPLTTWPAEALSKLGHLQQRRGKQRKIRGKKEKVSRSCSRQFSVASAGLSRTASDWELAAAFSLQHWL